MAFCMLCNSESHQPTTCEIADKWKLKLNNESENLTWITANTKSCIKCHKPIEKNQGCNYMKCISCGQEFCWVCMLDWPKYHTDHWKCNKYEEVKKIDPKLTQQEQAAAKAQNELKRLMFYMDRFQNHKKSIEYAEKLKPKVLKQIE